MQQSNAMAQYLDKVKYLIILEEIFFFSLELTKIVWKLLEKVI
jgi:hypothetical protein